MRFMILLKADKNTEAGVLPEREASYRDGEVQRRAGEGRRDARGRRAAAELEGRARQVFRSEADGDRRTLHRDEGTDRRLLDVAGEVDWRRRSNGSSAARIRSTGDAEIEIRQVFEAADFGAEFTPELREQEERLRAQVASKQVAT